MPVGLRRTSAHARARPAAYVPSPFRPEPSRTDQALSLPKYLLALLYSTGARAEGSRERGVRLLLQLRRGLREDRALGARSVRPRTAACGGLLGAAGLRGSGRRRHARRCEGRAHFPRSELPRVHRAAGHDDHSRALRNDAHAHHLLAELDVVGLERIQACGRTRRCVRERVEGTRVDCDSRV